MVSGIQILGILFGMSMLYLSFLHFKRKEFNAYQFFIWGVLWIGFIVVVLFPKSLNVFVQRLGVIRAFDLFSVVAFIVVFSLAFHNYVLIARLEKKLERRVREKALSDLQK